MKRKNIAYKILPAILLVVSLYSCKDEPPVGPPPPPPPPPVLKDTITVSVLETMHDCFTMMEQAGKKLPLRYLHCQEVLVQYGLIKTEQATYQAVIYFTTMEIALTIKYRYRGFSSV